MENKEALIPQKFLNWAGEEAVRISERTHCEFDAAISMAKETYRHLLPSPAIEGKEEDEDDGYEGPTPEQMNKYMQGVKFLLAYYGHNKAYIECREKDKGAINVGDGWVQEFDIAVGVNLRDRHFKFAVQKKLVQIGLSNDILKPLIKWLWAYKNSDDEQPHTEGN